MRLVRSDGNQIGVDVSGDVDKTTCQVASVNVIAAALHSDLPFEIAQRDRRRLLRFRTPLFHEQWVEAVHEDDVSIWRESQRNPLRCTNAGLGEIDTNDDARELHDPS